MGFNFRIAIWVGYIALFVIAVETGVVIVIYLHEALDQKIAAGGVPIMTSSRQRSRARCRASGRH
jgi:Cu/Ag efflux pump CusA